MSFRIVAKCEKCGRGFVYVNMEGDMIDTFFTNGEECGGKIVVLAPAETDDPTEKVER